MLKWLFVWLLVLPPCTAYAHIGIAAYQLAEVGKDGIRVELRMAADHVPAVSLSRQGAAPEAGARVLNATFVGVGDQPCTGGVVQTQSSFATNSLIVEMVFHCEAVAGAEGALTLIMGGPSSLGSFSLQYIEIVVGDRRDGFLRMPSAKLKINLSTLGDPPVIVAYFLLGIEHILSGLDHIAFLAAMMLAAGTVRASLIRATAFALTHTLTLALSVLKIIQVPAPVVEPLIAISITIATIDALWRPATFSSLAMATLFGAIHGMGFGAGLTDAGLPQHREVTAIAAFTGGIEFAQFSLILGSFAAGRLFSSQPPLFRKTARYGAIGVLITLSLFWYVDRLLKGSV